MSLENAFSEMLAAANAELSGKERTLGHQESEYNELSSLIQHLAYLKAAISKPDSMRSHSAERSSWSVVYKHRNKPWLADILKRNREELVRYLASSKERRA